MISGLKESEEYWSGFQCVQVKRSQERHTNEIVDSNFVKVWNEERTARLIMEHEQGYSYVCDHVVH